MVAVVSGYGLGLFNASNNTLGSLGVLGNGVMGEAGGMAFVNAATGNLVLQFQDEHLSGLGDITALRTYNSLGTMSDGLGADWSFDGEGTVVFTPPANLPAGTNPINSVGSTITRTLGDGSQSVFTWNATLGLYTSDDGAGAMNTLSYDATHHQWVFTDGSTRELERYGDSTNAGMVGRLSARIDSSGNEVDFGYDSSSRLTTITDKASGQYVQLVYGAVTEQVPNASGGTTTTVYQRLVGLNTFTVTAPSTSGGAPTGTLLSAVKYDYDVNGRLQVVTTELTANAGIGDGNVYTTNYAYDATGRLTGVSQSDGTSIAFAYDAQGRISQVSDAGGTQKFAYNAAIAATATAPAVLANTIVTDGAGNNWTYFYDSQDRLAEVDAPAPADGAAPKTVFTYDARGNVTEVSRSIDGNAADNQNVVYQYDAKDNQILQRDSQGDTIARFFDPTTNQLVYETQYATAGQGLDPTSGSAPSNAQTAYYVYDSQARLRFSISAQGRIVEYRYTSSGQLATLVEYAGALFDVTTVSTTVLPTLTALTQWAAAQDQTKTKQTLYTYDVRGNLASTSAYDIINSDGSLPTNDPGKTVTNYTYDAYGRLLQTVVLHGTQSNQPALISYGYDGLGRLVSQLDAGGSRTTSYAGHTITMTSQSNGLVELRSFDSRGRLISVSDTGNSTGAQGGARTTRTTQYFYDAAGRLTVTVDPQGNSSLDYYDADGRLQYNVNAAGAVCGYAYNGAGQLLTMTCYANIVTPANLLNVTTTTDNSTNPPTVSTSYALKNPTLSIGASGADVTTSADDRVISYSYDTAGRQITATDGAGTITTTRYDGESRVSSVTTGARQTQYFYDADGNQVGLLDPRGYLTEMKYDGASQLIESTEYATKSAGAINSTPVWIGVGNQTVAAGKAFSYRLPAIDADGNPLTYTASGLPSWLTMTTDAGGVTLSGTAPLTLTSSNVSIVASDGHASATASFSIATVNSPPAWVSLPDVQVAANSTGFSYKLPAATDDFSSALAYSITSALPTGLTFSGQTISGTPTVPGVYTITAKVTDSGKPALSTLRTFVLQVTGKGPVWQAVANQPATRTQAFSFTVPAASDPQNQALTYKMVSGPSWLTFDPIGLTLSGMPPASGSIDQPVPVVLQATDSNGEVMQVAFSINLQNAPPVWPANVNQPTPTHVGSFFNYQASPAVDPEGGIVHYQASGLPTGLNFDATTGAIWGIVNQINNFPVTIFAIDADGASSSINITISIVDQPPQYAGGLPDTTVMRGVHQGIVFNQNFVDPDGDALGSIFIVSAPPDVINPPGGPASGADLTLYSSDPVGTVFQVTVGVADSWGVVGTHTFNVTVTAPPPPPPPGPPRAPPPPPPGPPRPPGSPPIQPFARVNPPAGLIAPIGDAPAPTLIAAPAAAVSAPLSAPPPDPLAAFRPAATANDLLTFYFYDGEGRLVGEVNPKGFLTQTVYDVQDNRQQTIKFLSPVTVNTGANADTLGSLVSRATSAATAAGTVASETTTTQFDTFGRIASITGVDGTLTSFQYDAAGRLIREVLAAGSSDQRAMDTRYNDFDEVTGSLGGVGDALLPAGFTEAQLDAVLKTNGTQYTYDADGEMASSTDANGHITLFLHDAGNRADTIDATGAVTETLYNAFGEAASTRRYNSAIPATSTDPTVQTLTALQTTGGGVLSQAVAQQLNKMQSSTADEVEKLTYEHRGLVQTVTDAAGFTTTDSYDQFGQLHQQTRTITLASGSTPAVTTTSEFDYDLDGNLISTTANVGGINFNTQQSVDAFGRVTRSVDAAGNVTTTTYLNGGSTVQVQDPLNRKVMTQFDAFNRVTSIVDPLGNKTSYKYDDVNRTLTMTEQPLQSGVPGFSVVTTQTRAGETLSVTDARGTTTSYTYNADGQVTSAIQTSTITDSAGNTTTKTVTLSTDQYDNSGRLKSYTDALGTVIQLTYDAVNRVITKVTDPGGLTLTTKYSFDNFGRVTTEVDGANTSASRSITYKYDLDNRQTAIIVDPNGLKLQTLYKYDGLDDVLQVSQGTTGTPNQQVTQYVFDKLGRQIQRIDAPSSIVGAGPAYERDLTTQYRYNAAGEISRVIDADSNSTWYLYDADGELHQSIDALGNVTELNYDADGRLVGTRRYASPLSVATVAGFGDVASGFSVTPSSDDARSYFVYDNDGRQVYALTAKDANTWSVTQKFYDANGNVIESVAYDQYIPESWIQSNDPTGTSGFTAAQVSQEITSLYAAPGVTQAHVERAFFVYDASNRLRYSIDPLGDVSENIYDNAGNVIEHIRYAKPIVVPGNPTEGVLNGLVDRNNVGDQVTHYSFDRGGRLRYTVQVLSSDGAGNPTQQIVTERDYDALGQVTQIIGYGTYFKGFSGNAYDVASIGKALTSSVQDRRAEFAYDAAGRQVFSIQVLTIPGINGAAATVQNLVTQNTFDAMGHVTQTTVYANPMALTAYDRTTIGNAVNAHTSINDRTTRFVRDADGRERFTVLADGSFSEIVYDALGRVTETRKFDILVPSGTAMTESALENVRGGRHVGDGITRGVAYTYDADGEVTATKDAAGNVQSYTFDARGNMRTWTDARGALWTYSYDRLGHQIGIQSPQVMLQLEGDSQAKSYSLLASLTYDAFGNLTTRTDAVGTTEQRTTSYGYDVLNRHTDTTLPPALIQLSTDAAPVMRSLQTHVTYDALGNLSSSTEAYGTTDARETDYAYDALGRMIQVTLAGAYDPVSGHVVATQKDAQGNAIVPAGMFRRNTLTTYDAFGDAVSSREQTGIATYQYVYSTFDTLGRQTFAVDAMGYVTGYTYDAFGDQQTLTRYSIKVGAPSSLLAWDGTVLSVTLSGDTQARTVTTQYDAEGRKTLVQLPAVNDYFESSREFGTDAGAINPGTATPTTAFQYDAFGDLIHQSVQMDSRTQDTWHYYDAMGREVLTVDPMGFQIARSYDANGNLTFVTEFANAGTTNLTAKLPAPPPTSTNDRTTEYDYDAANQQTSVERLGWSFTFWNGTSYQLITNASSVATPYSYASYDSMGRVRTQIDALSNVTVTDYNLLGQAVSVTEPTRTTALMAATVQSVTVPTHSLVSGVSTGTMTVNVIVGAHAVGDPFVNLVNAAPVTTLTRDAFGNVVREDRNPEDGGPTRTTLRTFDLGGNLTSSTDPNTYALLSAVQTGNASLPQGTVASLPGPTVSYAYDFAGRLTDQRQVIQTTLANFTTVNQVLEKRYAYDALGRQTDAVMVYNGGTQQTGQHQNYDGFGELTATYKIWGSASTPIASLMQPPAAGSAPSYAIVASYTYDNDGRMQTQTSSQGVTTFYYDLVGDVTREEQRGLQLTTNSDGSVSVSASNDPNLPVKIMESGYDILGRSVIQRLPVFGEGAGIPGENPFTVVSYDRWGNVASRTVGATTDANGAFLRLGNTTYFTYNWDNQVTSVEDPLVLDLRADGTFYDALVTHTTGYDMLGREVLQSDSSYNLDSGGTTLLRTTNIRHYNQAGELTSQTDSTASNVTTRFAYDGNGDQVGSRNNIGGVLVDSFDNNGNLVTHGVLRLPGSDGNPADGAVYVSGVSGAPVLVLMNQYQYDQANRRVGQFTWAENNARSSYTLYDERNLVTLLEDGTTGDAGQGGITTYQYDQFGNRIAATDPVQNTQTWTYRGDAGDSNLNYTTDYGVGQLTRWAAGQVSISYLYNGFGQESSEVYRNTSNPLLAGESNGRAFSYYVNGSLRKVTDALYFPDSNVVTRNITSYQYTSLGQVSQEVITQNSTSGGQVFINGGLIQTLGGTTVNGLTRTTNTVYDADGRVIDIWSPNGQDANGIAMSSLQYRYDELGDRREIVADYFANHIQAPEKQQWFTYDSMGRMLIVNGALQNGQIVATSISTVLTYDALGQRASAYAFSQVNNVTVNNPPNPSFPNGTVDNISWSQFNTEHYTYNDLGYLTEIKTSVTQQNKIDHITTTVGGTSGVPVSTSSPTIETGSVAVVTADYAYDLGGEMISNRSYDIKFANGDANSISSSLDTTITSTYAAGGLKEQDVTVASDSSKNSRTTYQYDNAGNLSTYQFVQQPNTGSSHETDYQYTYTNEFGGEKLFFVSENTHHGSDLNGGTSNLYDERGNLVMQSIADPGPGGQQAHRQDSFGYDTSGHIISQVESANAAGSTTVVRGSREYFYDNGTQIAALGSDFLAGEQIDNNFTPISAQYPSVHPNSYTVNPGDTLAGIAQIVLGDPQLWYLIAEANNLNFGPTDSLASEVGKTYRIPTVINNQNNSNTTTPYNPYNIIGPTAPLPYLAMPSSQCSGVEKVVAVAVIVAAAIVVTALTEGAATSALTPYLGSALGAAVGAGAGAAAGSFAGQLTAVGLGQEKFSDISGWQILAAGASAAVGSGLGFSDETLGGRLADSTLDQVGNVIAGGQGDPTAATQGILDGLLSASPVGAAIGPSLTKILSKVGAGALDPSTGWAFNRDTRGDWETIVGQAIGQLAQFGAAGIDGLFAQQTPSNVDPLSLAIQSQNLQLSPDSLTIGRADLASFDSSSAEDDFPSEAAWEDHWRAQGAGGPGYNPQAQAGPGYVGSAPADGPVDELRAKLSLPFLDGVDLGPIVTGGSVVGTGPDSSSGPGAVTGVGVTVTLGGNAASSGPSAVDAAAEEGRAAAARLGVAANDGDSVDAASSPAVVIDDPVGQRSVLVSQAALQSAVTFSHVVQTMQAQIMVNNAIDKLQREQGDRLQELGEIMQRSQEIIDAYSPVVGSSGVTRAQFEQAKNAHYDAEQGRKELIDRYNPSTQRSSPLLTTVPRTAATLINTGKYAYGRAVAPVDVNGNRLTGTYYLWSGQVNKDAAKAKVQAKGGWLMSETPQHIAASADFAAALRREAQVRFPGQTFTDQQLFSMAGTQLKLQTPEMRAVWDPPSADVARRAVHGGNPVQGNLISPPGPDTVQTRIELPEVARAGRLSGGISIGAGGLTIIAGVYEQNPYLSRLSFASGGAQVIGGGATIYGTAVASAAWQRAGNFAGTAGAVLGAPLVVADVYHDLKSMQPEEAPLYALADAAELASIFYPPAAIGAVGAKYVALPAAHLAADQAASFFAGFQSVVYGIPLPGDFNVHPLY